LSSAVRTSSPEAPVVILHRLAFSSAESRLLEEAGVDVQRHRTVTATIAAMNDALRKRSGPCVVVVSLSVGSQAPEQILGAIREHQHAGSARVHVVPTSADGHNARRAQALGLDAVFSWPEGAFGEVVRVVAPGVADGGGAQVVLRRFAERAPAARVLGLHFGAGLQARIVNISTTGAMLECAQGSGDIESIGFEFSVGGASFPPVFGRVVWRETRGDRERLGLQFVDVSDKTRAAIARFVQDTNVVRVGGQRASTRATPTTGEKVRVQHGKRRDYFRLEHDDGGLALVPDEPFFVPYALGDVVDVAPVARSGGASFSARIVARQQRDPDRIDSRIAWLIERVRAIPAQLERATTLPPRPAHEHNGHNGQTEHHEAHDQHEGDAVGASWVALATAVDALAAATEPFGDSHEFLVLPSVHRAGEGFSARTFALRADGTPRLVLHEHDRFFALPRAHGAFRITVGRGDAVDIRIEHPLVSKVHALLHWHPEHGWSVEDTGSKNGTHVAADAFAVDDRAVPPSSPTSLQHGNVLRIGPQRMHFASAETLRAAAADLLTRRRARDGR
jgi:hypothetical protein